MVFFTLYLKIKEKVNMIIMNFRKPVVYHPESVVPICLPIGKHYNLSTAFSTHLSLHMRSQLVTLLFTQWMTQWLNDSMIDLLTLPSGCHQNPKNMYSAYRYMYVSSFGPRTSTCFINSTFLGSQYNFDLLGISNFKEDLEGVRFVIPTFLYESKNQRSLFPQKMPQNFEFY